MYNTKFLPQLKKFRRHLWGAGCVDARAAAYEASQRPYSLPPGVEVVECVQNPETGEWGPPLQKDSKLENEVQRNNHKRK